MITGAGRGIGKVLANVFVREGAKVLVADMTSEEKATAAELGAAAVSTRLMKTLEEPRMPSMTMQLTMGVQNRGKG